MNDVFTYDTINKGPKTWRKADHIHIAALLLKTEKTKSKVLKLLDKVVKSEAELKRNLKKLGKALNKLSHLNALLRTAGFIQ